MSLIDDSRRWLAIQNRFNPIRGLNPQKLALILDNFRLGYLREAALLWDAMIRRDLLIRNVASKRFKAVARAQYEILTVDDSPEALAQKKVLEVFYNNVRVTNALDQNERGGFGLLLRLMMGAQGMRFACFHTVYRNLQGQGLKPRTQSRQRNLTTDDTDITDENGDPQRGFETVQSGSAGASPHPIQFLSAEFTFVPLEFFENRTGRLRFLRNDFDVIGEELADGEWLIAVGDGIMEATSVAYCYKHLALKDWVACSEAFGTPIPWGKTDAAKDSPEWAQLETAVRQMMAQRAIVTSNTASIELIEMKNGGSAAMPFPPLVELMDRGIAAIWRGADLSTISQGQAGIGASLQGDEADLLLEDDAKWLAEILWDQVDARVLKYALGVDEPLAYVSILPPKRKNVAQDIQIDQFLAGMGCELSQDDAFERYGRGRAEPGEPVLAAQATAPDGAGNAPNGANGANGKMANALSAGEALRQAKRKLMGPVLQRLRVIDELEGEDKKHALMALQAELPMLRTRLENEAAAGEVADVLAEEMKRALLEGFSEKGFSQKETKGTKKKETR